MKTNRTDEMWFEEIKEGNEYSFQVLFDKYYISLCRYAYTLTESKTISEEIIQEIFVYVWEQRKSVRITSSVKSYLFTAARNKSLNYIRNQQKFIPLSNEMQNLPYEESDIETEELYHLVESAILSLPDKCREVFQMSRHQELSHKEIALLKGISTKTVESHISLALSKLKISLTALLK